VKTHPRAVLTPDQVLDLRRHRRNGSTVRECMFLVGVSGIVEVETAARAIRGETWTHLPNAVPGSKHHAAKAADLTPADVVEIRESHATCMRELADQYGVHPQTIRRVVSRKSWSWVGPPEEGVMTVAASA